jgi:acetyltransferase-like isoleucine patch superfamily enzyme
MNEGRLKGFSNRVLQELARIAPGARSLRVRLHRWRGVNIGENVWIGYDCILETSRPHLITIGANTIISIRAMLIAHFRGSEGIFIEEDVFIGPGAIILPNVRIGRGSVVAAGSVVSSSLPPMTVAQGNPARPIATCSVTLVGEAPLQTFYRSLRPIKKR